MDDYAQLFLGVAALWTAPGAIAGLASALLGRSSAAKAVTNLVVGGIGGFGTSLICASILLRIVGATFPKPAMVALFVLASVLGGLLLIWIVQRLFGDRRQERS